MKKNIIKGAFFFSVITINLVACKKEILPKLRLNNERQIVQVDDELNISSDNKMLIFKTVDDYEKIVNDPSEEIRNEFLSKVTKMKHTTYAEKLKIEKSGQSNDLIGSDYFAQILNEDLVVQIGSNLFRVNPQSEKVFVLPASRIVEYRDLVTENVLNEDIRQYSTGDNVIELVESGVEVEHALFCNQSQASNPDWSSVDWSAYEPYTTPVENSNHTYVMRYKRICKMNYLKLGIYFNLQAKLEVIGYVTTSASSTGTYGNTHFQTLNIITEIWSTRKYKIRCGNEHGWQNVLSTLTNGHHYNKTEYNSYQGSKGINKYWMKCSFSYHPNYVGSAVSVFSDNLPGENLYQREIKSGY